MPEISRYIKICKLSLYHLSTNSPTFLLNTSHSAYHLASCLTLPASLTPVVVAAAAAASAMRELLDPFQNELFSRK